MAAESLFTAPLLSALDARGRADLRAAATRREFAPGGAVFARGEPADGICLVESGCVSVESHGERPTVRAGEIFGRDALVGGTTREGHARALEASVVLEIPAGALRRALSRSGAGELFAHEEALARRRAWVNLLAGTPLGAGLSPRVLAELVASGREERRARTEVLFCAEEPAEFGWLVLRGLVELTRSEPASRARADAYAAAGDALALREVIAREPYAQSAVALGDVSVLRVPAAAFRALAEAHPHAVARAEAAAAARREKQRRTQDLAAGRATRHAFHELERLESARSLLAIDLGTCVRCGHCASACAETHGSARLLRRGDKVTLAVREPDGTLAERALLLAQACQHCKDPACLSECPTAAITRAADATVLVREDLCTGCGACAKACPWDAIRMAPRATTTRNARAEAEAAPGSRALVAQKCDLCHGQDGPECVSACPTGSIFRADPERDLVELRSVLGGAKVEVRAPRRGSLVHGLLVVSSLPPLVALARLLGSVEGSGFRYATGAFSGAVCGLLVLHAVAKRRRAARAWIQRRFTGERSRRGLEPLVLLHAVLGVLAVLSVLSHTGLSVPRGSAGALSATFWLLAASGAGGAFLYRVVPKRLARLERRGVLPEERAAEREELEQALFDGVSAENAAVKELARRVLVPYARARHGPVALVCSGRSLTEEQAVLARRVELLLGGRKSERLAGVGKLLEVAVMLRAFGARGLLETALRVWLPLHAVGAVLFLFLLALHVVGVLR